MKEKLTDAMQRCEIAYRQMINNGSPEDCKSHDEARAEFAKVLANIESDRQQRGEPEIFDPEEVLRAARAWRTRARIDANESWSHQSAREGYRREADRAEKLVDQAEKAVENRQKTAPQPAAPVNNTTLIHTYNSGYKAGHHDTVEGRYTDVHQSDMDTYHADVVADLVADLSGSQNENCEAQPAVPSHDSWHQLAAYMYQAAGAFNMPVRFLDILTTAANGEPFEHMLDDLLPVTKSEGGVGDRDAAPAQEPIVPDGWELAPVEPTHEMLDAQFGQATPKDCYQSMLAAAPFLAASAQEPSDATQPLLDALETLCAGLAWSIKHYPNVMTTDDYENLTEARALLARYGSKT